MYIVCTDSMIYVQCIEWCGGNGYKVHACINYVLVLYHDC